MNQKYEHDKATDAIIFILQKIPEHSIARIKLMNLLYLIERTFIQDYKTHLFGGCYVASDIGCFIQDVDISMFLYDEITDLIILNTNSDFGHLSIVELDTINSVFTKFGQMDMDVLITYTSELPEWNDNIISVTTLLSYICSDIKDFEETIIEWNVRKEINSLLD